MQWDFYKKQLIFFIVLQPIKRLVFIENTCYFSIGVLDYLSD